MYELLYYDGLQHHVVRQGNRNECLEELPTTVEQVTDNVWASSSGKFYSLIEMYPEGAD